jgi:hypothetical protein
MKLDISEYLTEEQINYLRNNIEDVFMFNSDNSNLSTNS